MAKIFLSHAHADKELAHELGKQIRTELAFSDEDVFVTSEPQTIPTGEDWIEPVKRELKEKQVCIPLITPSSEKSMWVAFEYGNFWALNNGSSIFPLLHPKANISDSPLNILQARIVTDKENLKKFFVDLCTHFKCGYTEKADLDAIVEKAMKTPAITSADRQFQMVCKLHLITATNYSVKNAILRWMKERDILHDAQLDWLGDLQRVTFESANMQRINLIGNDLRGASFWASNLEDAIFGGTQLQGADFNHVTSLRGASFQRATLDRTTTLPDGQKYNEELGREQLLRWGAVIDR